MPRLPPAECTRTSAGQPVGGVMSFRGVPRDGALPPSGPTRDRHRRRPRAGGDVQAVVYERNGGPEVLTVRDVPDVEPGDGEVLVDVEAVGVNFRDVYEREGRPPYTAAPPTGGGVEGAGTVVGPGGGGARARRPGGHAPPPAPPPGKPG